MISDYVFKRFSNQRKTSKRLQSKDTTFDYAWTPSLDWSPASPTLVYFTGYDGNLPKKPARKSKWNVLYILDDSGNRGKGSWFFGKDGKPDILNSIREFIDQMILCGLVNKKYLFFSGKGMGGHAALYFQSVFSGSGCYCHNPTSNLLSSHYATEQHPEIFSPVFDHNNPHE